MAKEIGDYINEVIKDKGNPLTWQQANRIIQEAELNLGVDRQNNYGSRNIEEFGQHGILIRMWDKFARLKNMLFNNLEDKSESLEDSFGDLANYSNYGIMVGRGWWNLPLE